VDDLGSVLLLRCGVAMVAILAVRVPVIAFCTSPQHAQSEQRKKKKILREKRFATRSRASRFPNEHVKREKTAFVYDIIRI
jgi:hypothetical protein